MQGAESWLGCNLASDSCILLEHPPRNGFIQHLSNEPK